MNLRSRAFMWRCCALLAGILIPISARAHASLVSSSPINGSSAATAPARIRLLFTEPVEAAMSNIVLVGSDGDSRSLVVASDPRNVNAIVANVGEIAAGQYSVRWQALSADGHSVSGTLTFTVLSGDSAANNAVSKAASSSVPVTSPPAPSQQDVSILTTWAAMLARGLGMSALLAFAGLIFFSARAQPGSSLNHSRVVTALGAITAAALLAHFYFWVLHVSSIGFSPNWLTKVFQTNAGRNEVLRALFAVLALWGWWLARRSILALTMAAAAIVVSALIGHSAAIDPKLSILAKVVHLGAGAVWMGGLAWLLLLDREKPENYAREARKVSFAAGICALAVLVSGLLQAGAVLSWDANYLRSSYALIAGMKLLGFLVLLGFGAYNRYRVLPWLEDRVAGRDLQRTVSREMVIMVMVALLGGVLAYVSPPMAMDHSQMTGMTK